jgi:ADP-heptose:LPS heptosyltransferase
MHREGGMEPQPDMDREPIMDRERVMNPEPDIALEPDMGSGRRPERAPEPGPTDEPRVAVGQSLAVTAALYARAALVIGPDGGPAHLAAAVGTPTIRLYGPAPVARFGPWPPRADQVVLVDASLACVPCGVLDNPPCGARTEPACMLALGVSEVLDAARRVLSTD